MSTSAESIRAQFEVSEDHSLRIGAASYRPPAADADRVLLGHDGGYDHVAFLHPGAAELWTSKTAVLDVGRSNIGGMSEQWLEGAYIIRYGSSHRVKMLEFVSDLIERVDPGDVIRSTDAAARDSPRR